MLPVMIEKHKVLELAQGKETAFRVAIACSDFLSSCLMVNALQHDLKCEALPVQSCDLLGLLGASKFDVVIIGSVVDSESGGGFELVRNVSRAHPEARILVLLGHTTRETVITAFQAGARAVLGRQESMSELLNCVEHVRKGMIWAGKEESRLLLQALSCIPVSGLLAEGESNSLTKREFQVAQCASRGMTNKSIASELGLSEHTVKNYLFRAFEKLGVSSRVELLFHLTSRGQSLRGMVADPAEGDRSGFA